MTSSKGRVNWAAIILLVVLQQGIGAGWYALWGEPWMTAIGKTAEDFSNAGTAQYGVSVLLSLILTFGMAKFWLAMGTKGFGRGVAAGVVCWLIFIATYQGVHTSFEAISHAALMDPQTWVQPAIDTGMSLVVFALNGGVLAAWRAE